MAKIWAILGLGTLLMGCTNYGATDFTGTASDIALSDTVRTAALGGLVGGAANYAIGADPITGLAIGAVTGAAIDYFNQ